MDRPKHNVRGSENIETKINKIVPIEANPLSVREVQ